MPVCKRSILLASVLFIFSVMIVAAHALNATESHSEFNITTAESHVPSNDSASIDGQQTELNNSTGQYSNDSTGLQLHFEFGNSTEQSFNDSNTNTTLFEVNYTPKEKRRRLLEELTTAIAGTDEMQIKALSDPEHPYINATTGQCFNHVITSFSKACIVSQSFGGWRKFKGFFAVACKALGLKRHRITECINRVCKKFPYLKI